MEDVGQNQAHPNLQIFYHVRFLTFPIFLIPEMVIAIKQEFIFYTFIKLYLLFANSKV